MKKPLKPISGAVPDEVLRRLLAIAQKEKRSLASVVRIALEKYVQRRRAA